MSYLHAFVADYLVLPLIYGDLTARSMSSNIR